MTMSRLVRLFLLVSLAATAPAIGAQERSLHWRTLAVDARLDSAGQLHVRERQVMVFTGDWNGGERRFDTRLGPRFQFERLLVVDSVSGAERELTRGDIADVDRFDWGENRTLRWRSRLPSDPPFSQTELTYILEYSWSNVVMPRDGGLLLNHDFAFAARSGAIDAFTLKLDLHPAWRAPAGFMGSYGPAPLSPGEGFVVRVPLEYVGAGRPSGVTFGARPVERYALAALLVAGVVVLVGRLFQRERSLGRFAPLAPTDGIDEAWIREHVLHMLPEVVGAAWDGSTGAAEVAAVLARLVAEKKLKSEVRTSGRGPFQQHDLHLELLVERDTLNHYERALIDALFPESSTVTDTRTVRERYTGKGFNPASKISDGLQRILDAASSGGTTMAKPSRRPTLILLLGAVGLFVLAGNARATDAVLAAIGSLAALVIYGIAMSQAAVWQKRVRRPIVHSLRFLIPVAALGGGVLALLITDVYPAGPFVLAGFVALVLALGNSVLNLAKSRQSAEFIRSRKRLESAREYFRHQLKQPQPMLRDEWYPYFLAFGLGKSVDRWFRAFGPESHRASAGISTMATSGGSSGSTSNGGGSWSGFGGGGAFAGGGSSGVWAAAAGSMAAGVAAPSSSSSSGGSSGGSSSGGGGGGGW
jgi:uncharacterized membrane protein YgcG